MGSPRPPPRPRPPRGEITWVGIAFLLGAVGAAWLAWALVPAYMLHLEVKQVVREFANEAVKTSDDAGLVERMTQRIRALAQDEAPLEDGGVERRPAVDVRPQDVAWERLPGDQLHVAFEYDRELALPFVQRRMPRHFSVDLTLDVTRAQWGSTR